MRWARINLNNAPSYAVIEGDTVIPVRGSPFESWERTQQKLQLSDVKLLVPVVSPTFYAAGMNYAEHVREVAAKLGHEPNLPKQADIGYRANNALVAHDEPIIIPADATEQVQYEGELVVVIGRKCRNLTRDDALSAVLGYTVGNDVSERTWQKSDRTLWRAKNTDTFKPMGPWIETDVRLEDLITRIRLNGEEIFSFATNHMIFGVVDYLVSMTRYLTLYPGDMVWMGTEGATRNIKHGDRIEVDISGIGTLSNPVVRAAT